MVSKRNRATQLRSLFSPNLLNSLIWYRRGARAIILSFLDFKQIRIMRYSPPVKIS